MMATSDIATQVHFGWASSILCEAGVLLTCLDDLRSGVALVTLVDTLCPHANLRGQVTDTEQRNDRSNNIQIIQIVLNFLAQFEGTSDLSANDVADGPEDALVEVLWRIAFHLNVILPGAAPCERTEEAGVQQLLEWCLLMLPGVTIDTQQGLATNLCSGNLLVDLISQVCPVEQNEDAVELLLNAMVSAEEFLGINKYILDPPATIEGSIPERHLALYLALLRRKIQQLEPVGPCPRDGMDPDPPDKAPGGDMSFPSPGVDMDFLADIKDPQQILDLIGQQPISEEMLQQLQEQFGPIEIEIVEESSEESGEDDLGEDVKVDDDVESGTFNVWPQQPIRYESNTPDHVPLLMELEQAEEVHRLSEEVSAHHRRRRPPDEGTANVDGASLTASGVEGTAVDIDTGRLPVKEADLERSVRKNAPHLGVLSPPWLSPIPFPQSLAREGGLNKSTGGAAVVMHSTPRAPGDGMNEGGTSDDANAQQGHLDDDDVGMDEAHLGQEVEEMDLDDLSKEDIQNLLMSAQMEGVSFDPRLIDLAAAHGLEFEIVMEDEDGNVINGLPDGDPITSSNFAELVQELKAVSGQDLEMSIQRESIAGIDGGNTIAGGAARSAGGQQHNRLAEVARGNAAVDQETHPFDKVDHVQGTIPEKLHDSSDEVLIEAVHKHSADGIDCSCPNYPIDGRKTTRSQYAEQTTQHFHNSDVKAGIQGPSSRGEHFQMQNNRQTATRMQEESPKSSSEGETDNEAESDDRGRKSASTHSEKSFSSSTSVDGVIDTRAEQSDYEEEVVITIEVPGIPTEDGGFMIDMSKMFIPISIPAEGGTQEITVEIDPSNFDFSSMVQNEDGTFEVDIEREIHNWMAKSNSRFTHPGASSGCFLGDENGAFSSANYNADATRTSGQTYPIPDAQVTSAIRAAITEQLHFPNKSNSDDSTEYNGPTIRPLSETPPQLDSSTTPQDSSGRLSPSDSSSFFDVSAADDEVLQLLEQIGKHGVEMKRELQNSQQREICLYQEKSQEEVRLGETVALLEKELQSMRLENSKLYKYVKSGKRLGQRDQDKIHRLESAMEDLQGRILAIQRDNTNLRTLNTALDKTSKKVFLHKCCMTDVIVKSTKTVQVGTSVLYCRTRAVQTAVVRKADFTVQMCGYQFSHDAMTSTRHPASLSMHTLSSGTQTATNTKADRSISTMSVEEQVWFRFIAHAETQVSEDHQQVIPQEGTHDADVVNDALESAQRTIGPIYTEGVSAVKELSKPDTKYPWHQARNTESQPNVNSTQQPLQQQRRSNIPVKANQPHRPVPLKADHRQQATLIPTKPSSQAVDKLFNQIHGGESPPMENSGTESMDTDEEPEGPDKWQRLSSMTLMSDPLVIKLQRSLASATLENDLLHGQMKKAKVEMSMRLEEWAELLVASKLEMDPSLYRKITLLENTLVSAEVHNTHLGKQLEAAGRLEAPATTEGSIAKLHEENSKLKATLASIQVERKQLVTDLAHLEQHHKNNTSTVANVESSLLGMTNERQKLQKEVQNLRNEYQHLKKGMLLMERYFKTDVAGEASISQATSGAKNTTSGAVTVAKLESVTLLQNGDQVVEESAGAMRTQIGVEGSLHKHISALAARIQSELGIKVQLVGEVDPVEILGASIHSQEGHPTSTPIRSQEDLSKTDAVEHLFQSVRTDRVDSKRKGAIMELQPVEDIIKRAIPSPRDMSPASSRGEPHSEGFDKNDIENLDTAELRRKRLGMFLESYTKSRSVSPKEPVSLSRETKASTLISGAIHRSSPMARPEMTLEDLEVPTLQGEPSTEHQTKMHWESRHQIKTQQPPWASNSGQSDNQANDLEVNGKCHDNMPKAEMIRRKLTTSTPLLPSRFSMSSVGVSKFENNSLAMEENGHPRGQPAHALAQPRWRPFSRLTKPGRLMQERKSQPSVQSRSHTETEAASIYIQEDVLSSYAGEVQAKDSNIQSISEPVPAVKVPASATVQQRPIPVPRTSRAGRPASKVPAKTRPAEGRYEQRDPPTYRPHPVPQNRQAKVTHPPTPTLQEPLTSLSRPSRDIPPPQTNTEKSTTLFNDYDYTDYLLTKYCKEEESTSTTTPSDATTPLSSSQENGEVSSSDSDTQAALGTHWAHPPLEPQPSHQASRKGISKGAMMNSTTRSSTTRASPHVSAQSSSRVESDPAAHYNARGEYPVFTDSNPDYAGRSNVKVRSSPSSNPAPVVYSKSNSRSHSDQDSMRLQSRSRTKVELGNYGTSSSSLSSQTKSAPTQSSRVASQQEVASRPSSQCLGTPKPWHAGNQSNSYATTANVSSKPEGRSSYSEYCEETDKEGKYWSEPKQYDYRHGLSTAWMEPRRFDLFGAANSERRPWSDVAAPRPTDSAPPVKNLSASPNSYSTNPHSRSYYETYTADSTIPTATPDHQYQHQHLLTSPYKATADRYRFTSSPQPESNPTNSSYSYYPRGGSSAAAAPAVAPSGFSRAYDRTATATSPPPCGRSYVPRPSLVRELAVAGASIASTHSVRPNYWPVGVHSLGPDDILNRPLVTEGDYRNTVGSPAPVSVGGDLLRRPTLTPDPFISDIRDPYPTTGSGRGRHTNGLMSETSAGGKSSAPQLTDPYLAANVNLGAVALNTPNYRAADPYSTASSMTSASADLLTGSSYNYGSATTPAAFSTSRVKTSISSTSRSGQDTFPTSTSGRVESSYSRVASEVGGYGLYSGSGQPGPTLRPRDRRTEIEELLNKYAPLR